METADTFAFDGNTQVDTKEVVADYEQVHAALQQDPEFFIQYFLAHELFLPVPEIHKISFTALCSSTVSRLVLALPRGFAKTTLAKLSVVWHYLFTDYRYVVYLSVTKPIAQNAVKDIIGYMESYNFSQMYGELEWKTRRDGDGFYEFYITVDGRRKFCILNALGAGQQVRGLNIDNQRPQLAVVDDLEDEENTATEFLQNKLKSWVYGAFFKAMAPLRNKIIWLGTTISVNCILLGLVKSDSWHSMLFGAIKSDGTPLWPELWSLEALYADYSDYANDGQSAKWFSEMMNLPIPGGSGLIRSEDIRYHPHREPSDIETGFITIDPAMSKKTSANSTGIAVHGMVEGKWEIVDFVEDKLDVFEMFDKAIELCYKWQLNVIGIEGVLFSTVLKPFFDHLCLTKGIHGIEIVLLPAREKKTERLLAWCGMIRAGEYSIPAGDMQITQQLLTYNTTKDDNKDDLIDACAHGVFVLTNFMHLIMQRFSMGVIAKVQRERAICAL